MWQQVRRYSGKVRQQIAFRQRPASLPLRPEHLVQVGQRHLLVAHREREFVLGLPQLFQHIYDVVHTRWSDFCGDRRRGWRDHRLPHRLSRRLVRKSPERRCPQVPVGRPLRELHAHDYLRPHPRNLRLLNSASEAKRAALKHVEGRLLDEQLVQLLLRGFQHPVVEASAYVPDEDEPPLVVVLPQDERAEGPCSPPCARRVTANNELIRGGALDLEPRFPSSPRLVETVLALRHQPLHPQSDRRFVRLLTVGVERLHEEHVPRREQQLFQHRAPVGQGRPAKVVSAGVEQVENVEVDRDLFLHPLDVRFPG